MRIRPISIAGMSMAVWVTAVLVFLAGLPVPAQAEENILYVMNKSGKTRNFCTYKATDSNRSNQKDKKTIRKNQCKPLWCKDSCIVAISCRYGGSYLTVDEGTYVKFLTLKSATKVTDHTGCSVP